MIFVVVQHLKITDAHSTWSATDKGTPGSPGNRRAGQPGSMLSIAYDGYL